MKDFLKGKSDVLNRVLKQAKAPLKEAASVKLDNLTPVHRKDGYEYA